MNVIAGFGLLFTCVLAGFAMATDDLHDLRFGLGAKHQAKADAHIKHVIHLHRGSVGDALDKLKQWWYRWQVVDDEANIRLDAGEI